MNEIIGAIYPIPTQLADRLFDGKTKVFVKYIAHNTSRLVPKHKIVFYASRGSKKLVGEGTIETVEFLCPKVVIEKYKEGLFLNKDEFDVYVKSSPSRTPSKKILTLVLKKVRKYPSPVEYGKPITMAGQYLSAAEYDSLMHKRRR